ncbi:hypothetical protein IB642_01385 [Allofrancisella guangzhouensis]|uniref:Uncharacterized protein n=1 Tax=Allofrancisella guangzhouensis TaxID=594679 RepID=A0A0A8E3C3_9GAMM|nr:hypothetical protein [Allofrancisella guangzhouensis]AJC48725.1 hypothetical protein SD28_03245 [Allofrancisella guangzhouensis]MBK2027396.1 hypothetical protein [Allofrancisella guangzhouensis]MBK2043672.1 hypothetical protein [Allofrancisella guangzhouensis]MBK2045188.1 hypothetical protein [Allofrancisella guangzhouensis]
MKRVLKQDAIVTFPADYINEEATVIVIKNLLNGIVAVVTDISPFHPVDHLWPDHSADSGELILGDKKFTITECLIVAFDQINEELLFDGGIKIRAIRCNQAGWLWVIPCGGTHSPVLKSCQVKVTLTQFTSESFEMKNQLMSGGNKFE